MKELFKTIVLSVALAIGLTACANLKERQNQKVEVLSSQLDVLKKTKQLREQDDVKLRVSKDPVLSEKEKALLDALNSVIDSQEAYLKTLNKL